MKLLPFLLLLILLQACSTVSYYSQSIKGHLQVWWPSVPIKKVLEDPNTDEATREKLLLVLQVREFAVTQLKLPDNDSYRVYTDLHRDSLLWNVYAAPEFSVEAKTWCYLVVGCVSYRGYYDKEAATSYAAQITQEQFDVYVGEVGAYSTLGWFDDPVLNTMIKWHDFSLTGLIFHELAHQIIYINGDTDFNEAFASAVEQIGLQQWITQYRPDQLKGYQDYLQRKSNFKQLLLTTRHKLQTLYQQQISDDEKRQKKTQIFAQMRADYEQIKQQWGPFKTYDRWFEKPLNNARLSSEMTYQKWIPAFHKLFEKSNKDWKLFYQAVISLEDLSKEARQHYLQSL